MKEVLCRRALFIALAALLLAAVPCAGLTVVADGTTIIIQNATVAGERFYTIEQLEVSGELGLEGKLEFSGILNVRGDDVHVSIFSGETDVGIASVDLDYRPTDLFFSGEEGYFFTADEGRHTFSGTLNVRESAVDEKRANLGFSGPIATLSLEIDVKGAPDRYVHITAPEEGEKEAELGGTRYTARFYSIFNESIVVEWVERGFKPEEAPTVPMVFSESVSRIVFEELEVTSENLITYQAFNKKISALSIEVEGEVLSVSGPEGFYWEVLEKEGTKVLSITLPEEVGEAEIGVKLLHTPKSYPGSFTLPYPVVAVDADSQECYAVISSIPEISVGTTPGGFREISMEDVPKGIEPELKSIAFKGTSDGYFEFAVEKLEIQPVITAAADSAYYTHVLLENGILSDVEWQVKNTAEEYMYVTLPAESTLFYVGIDGTSVKPVKKEDKLAIPLKRSEFAYPIEVVYYNPGRIDPIGQYVLPIPSTSVPLSNLLVSAYIPEDNYYLGSLTNLHKDTSSDFPEWRGTLLLVAFIFAVSYLFSSVTVKKESTRAFAGLLTLFLYFFRVLHQDLFVIAVVLALGYYAKSTLKLQSTWAKVGAGLVAVFLLFIFGIYSLSLSSVPSEREDMRAGAPSERMLAPMVEEALEKAAPAPLMTAPSVPTKKGVEGVRILVPEVGRYISFSSYFETVARTPSARIFSITKDVVYVHYLLAVYLGLLCWRRHRLWKKERK